MIARYAIDIGPHGRPIVELDEDGAWVRWNDVRSHVDRAIHSLNVGEAGDCLRALRKIVDREKE